MKLKFRIDYRTPFGQSVHIKIDYVDAGRHTRQADLAMHTEDGRTWQAETSGIVISHERTRFIIYHYTVEDDEGQVMRREWNGVPRIYPIDTTRTYLFRDAWRDLSPAHYLTAVHRPEKVYRLADQPYFERSVVFRVSAPQVGGGESVALLGSEPVLGAWCEKRYLLMHYVGDGDWMLPMNAYALNFPFSYKYVVIDNRTHRLIRWEKGENRTTDVERLEPGEQLMLHGGNLRTPVTLVFRSELTGREDKINYELPDLYL